MQSFRRCQQCRIQLGDADRPADRGYAPLDHRQEGRVGILQQVPAIGDLNGFWQGLRDGAAIDAVAVADDHFDLRMGTQPGFDRGRRAIRQQIDHPASFQIADQRAVALALAPGPVVDANYPRFRHAVTLVISKAAQERILADGQRKPPPERLRWTSAQCQREEADKSLQAGYSPPMGAGQAGIQSLGKDRAAALARAAAKSSDLHHQVNVKAMRRQIGEAAAITAVNPSGSYSTLGARRPTVCSFGRNLDLSTVETQLIDQQPSRQKILLVQARHQTPAT